MGEIHRFGLNYEIKPVLGCRHSFYASERHLKRVLSARRPAQGVS